MNEFITAKEVQEKRFDGIREVLNEGIMQSTLMGMNQLAVWSSSEYSSDIGNLYSPSSYLALKYSKKLRDELITVGFTVELSSECVTIVWKDN